MDQFLRVAQEAAYQAGALLQANWLQTKTIEVKTDIVDLVTNVDKAADALITGMVRARFPTHQILAEESAMSGQESPYRWYIDPLDGTTNFAHGYPMFAVSLGLVYRHESIAGVVYDPVREELFSAERGAGSYLNHKRIRVSKVGSLSEGLLATGFPPSADNNNLNVKLFSRFMQLSHGIRRPGSAALDLCSVAAGRFEAFWELKLNPWDKAAGSLVVTEAGGRVSDLAGGPFKLLGDEILSSNGLVHGEMCRVFSEVAGARAGG